MTLSGSQTVNSIFSNSIEVHSAELGLVTGGLVLALMIANYRGYAFTLSLSMFFLAIGIIDVKSPAVSTIIQPKPWYFLVPITACTLGAVLYQEHIQN